VISDSYPDIFSGGSSGAAPLNDDLMNDLHQLDKKDQGEVRLMSSNVLKTILLTCAFFSIEGGNCGCQNSEY